MGPHATVRRPHLPGHLPGTLSVEVALVQPPKKLGPALAQQSLHFAVRHPGYLRRAQFRHDVLELLARVRKEVAKFSCLCFHRHGGLQGRDMVLVDSYPPRKAPSFSTYMS